MILWQIKEQEEAVNVVELVDVDVLEDVFAKKNVTVDVVVEREKRTEANKIIKLYI